MAYPYFWVERAILKSEAYLDLSFSARAGAQSLLQQMPVRKSWRPTL